MSTNKQKVAQQARTAGGGARRAAKKAADKGTPLVEWLARFGYASVGVVYLTLGVLAFEAAYGTSNPHIDQNTVLHNILSRPFGRTLLILLTIGLVGFALWRLIQAIFNPEHERSVLKRVGHGISGVAYGALAYAAIQLDMGLGSSSGNSTSKLRDVTATVMTKPLGRWLIGLVGLAIVGLGLALVYNGYRGKFEQRFKAGELSAQQKHFAIQLGRAGYSARGIVYLLIGGFLVQAALQYNPQKAGGLADALAALAALPFGTIWLAVVGLGLVAYGLYAILLAGFRRLQIR
jgi:hypothetical protein